MKKWAPFIICSIAMFGVFARAQEGQNAIYKDANAAIPDRVHDLLGRMTVEEKVAQLESGWTLPPFGTFQIPSAVEGDHINEVVAKKIASNGLGTYAFLDEFLGT